MKEKRPLPKLDLNITNHCNFRCHHCCFRSGETIFEDRRKDIGSAWERLAEYIGANNLSITKLRLQLGPLEVPLPDHQEGYIQIKKFWSTGADSDLCYKVGYIQGGLALIHEVSATGSSRTYRGVPDPGAPITIYNKGA